MKSLAGKVVVVTGAASGIGRALAFELAGAGAKLALADVDAARLDEVAATIRSRGAACITRTVDVASEMDVSALAAEVEQVYGGADVVVNNAGVSLVAPVASLELRDAHWLMGINFWGVVHGCRTFLPQLRAKPEATIVNVSSIFAMVSVPTQSMYNAAKAAVRGFSDALREELRGTGIRVLCVHPGGIRTRIVEQARVVDLAGIAASHEELRERFHADARTSAEDAAKAVVAAIRSGRERLLIGPDAHVLDWLWRLFPARTSRWLVRLGRRRIRR
jgi:NAD(P)-dependent dehydrogenase (short-subunit alcohol dehydrogenase family)